jgi:hypothetical protein
MRSAHVLVAAVMFLAMNAGTGAAMGAGPLSLGGVRGVAKNLQLRGGSDGVAAAAPAKAPPGEKIYVPSTCISVPAHGMSCTYQCFYIFMLCVITRIPMI